MGGETRSSATHQHVCRGLSPRGRGNHVGGSHRWTATRSIPAWAGKPGHGRERGRLSVVYPRVGGETLLQSPSQSGAEGLSPRGRGNQGVVTVDEGYRGSIPAWAGKPAAVTFAPRKIKVYPRVGGETSPAQYWSMRTWGLSPRGRGNLSEDQVALCLGGSIPAWAGKPLRHSDSFVCICQRSLVLLGRYGGSPAMCRIRFHTSLASGSAR